MHFKISQKTLNSSKKQFASIDAPLLNWDFELKDQAGQTIGAINKDFRGIAKEVACGADVR
jgi:hypothetical protein